MQAMAGKHINHKWFVCHTIDINRINSVYPNSANTALNLLGIISVLWRLYCLRKRTCTWFRITWYLFCFDPRTRFATILRRRVSTWSWPWPFSITTTDRTWIPAWPDFPLAVNCVKIPSVNTHLQYKDLKLIGYVIIIRVIFTCISNAHFQLNNLKPNVVQWLNVSFLLIGCSILVR